MPHTNSRTDTCHTQIVVQTHATQSYRHMLHTTLTAADSKQRATLSPNLGCSREHHFFLVTCILFHLLQWSPEPHARTNLIALFKTSYMLGSPLSNCQLQLPSECPRTIRSLQLIACLLSPLWQHNNSRFVSSLKRGLFQGALFYPALGATVEGIGLWLSGMHWKQNIYWQSRNHTSNRRNYRQLLFTSKFKTLSTTE
ncbi:hypothetical protein XELAEV_18039990mg [Xenopus laevis]|uniref:Uncharacterized protein n=1 Tax=Xenopus laevis TaxID=8355 RepID=A0A974H8F7_XENLA|nr:hypothetical protein XELAEV_18039990mg [Xenopus laevis]